MSEIAKWVEAAGRAAAEGRWQEAEQAWSQVLRLDPEHPEALYSVGVHAFRSGRLEEALHAFQSVNAARPGDPVVLLSISRVLRERGDTNGELHAINSALAADPYFVPGLLAKGEFLERSGKTKAAVNIYRNALKVAPDESRWPAALRAQLNHGKALVQRFGNELSEFLGERMDARIGALSPFEAERWREAGAILSGRSQPYPSTCNQLYVPRLPAIPFFERAQFEWVRGLESRTQTIIDEFRTAHQADQEEFQPYVGYAPGTPVNQWRELNHSRRWSGYFLWNNGAPVDQHIERCPQTAQALNEVGLADIPGMCPNAMFSALAPHTHIPPHTGDTNARLVVHLPLIVPEGCSYRVGFERRQWRVGEVLVFDDSIDHEARNDSDYLRVVLIFDIWNPLLSEGEREMVRLLTVATREFEFSS